MRRFETGFSLLELITAAAIAAVVISMLVPKAYQLWERTEAMQQADLYLDMTGQVMEAADGDYTGFDTQFLLDNQLVPADLRDGNRIRNRWDGTITTVATPSVTFEGGLQFSASNSRSVSFSSSLNPRSACISITEALMDGLQERINLLQVNGRGLYLTGNGAMAGTGTDQLAEPGTVCNRDEDNIITWRVM